MDFADISVSAKTTDSFVGVDKTLLSGFPRGIEVLNFKIGFQDLEKLLNLTKICIGIEKVWKF